MHPANETGNAACRPSASRWVWWRGSPQNEPWTA